jgi:5-methylcytosine-specific restriction protein A
VPTLPATFRPHGQPTRQETNRQADQRRGSARERGYSPAWDKASRGHLARDPLCRYCAIGAFGRACVAEATVVDHLYPQRQFPGVFWRTEFWVSACVACHSGPKQAVERQGKPALDALARRLGLDPLAA